jgi:pilus assembly protein Flp/PilA
MSWSAHNFITNESGATAIEYGLIATLISIVIISAAKSLGSGLNTFFNQIATNLN